MKKRLTILAFLVTGLIVTGQAQIHVEGTPIALQENLKGEIPFFHPEKEAPGYRNGGDKEFPLYAGYIASFPERAQEPGIWIRAKNGKAVWRLGISVKSAGGLNVYFKNVNFSEGQQLFLYNPSKTTVLGAFTKINNGDNLATELIPGDSLIIELDSPQKTFVLPFTILDIGVSVLNMDRGERGFGDAGACEVLVNCPEGGSWQNEKRGVAKILVRDGSSLFWCTGSLVNNTKVDGTPYFLTANHCGENSSDADYSKWVFYFNYESTDCDFPVNEPLHQTLSGSTLIASANQSTSTGSDFKLLLLKNEVPKDYRPFYNGWNRSGEVSASGVTIHHPEGDLKMVSTYETQLVSTDYNSPEPNPEGQYWKVVWTKTESGFGVTEPGSSGSPLFDPSGYIIGLLSGGRASCGSPRQPDYYGKFSESWMSNGTADSLRLQPWLDPINSGLLTLRGVDFDSSGIMANFSADIVEISTGGQVRFYNNSSGNITSSQWYFPGGDPSGSELTDPLPVTYHNAGEYDVKLVVRSANSTDSLIRKKYIRVLPSITPNPSTTGKFKITFGSQVPEDLRVSVTDINGRDIQFFASPVNKSSFLLDLSTNSSGVYLVKIISKGETRVLKAVVSQ
ncbi:MAG: trypsin-like serine protease [Chlorobi bacterium]|nr:trypsin-like serine protease [Chlorobiota bacterium]